MKDKLLSVDEVAAELADGMTVGIGGWGSRRKPMALVRAIVRSGVEGLTVVSYGGPDVGVLCATGQAAKVAFGFVSLDSIPLEPHFRAARQAGRVEAEEYDEGMFQWGLYAAATRMPFFPTRSGLGSDLVRNNPDLSLVDDPYGSGQYVAMRPLHLDVALVHANVADPSGNAMFTGPDPYFDDLFCLAADRAFVSAEHLVPTGDLLDHGPVQALRVNRAMVTGVVEAPRGAHFTSCAPDYPRDEAFQRSYAATAKDPDAWEAFRARFLDVSEADYEAAVREEVGA